MSKTIKTVNDIKLEASYFINKTYSYNLFVTKNKVFLTALELCLYALAFKFFISSLFLLALLSLTTFFALRAVEFFNSIKRFHRSKDIFLEKTTELKETRKSDISMLLNLKLNYIHEAILFENLDLASFKFDSWRKEEWEKMIDELLNLL